MIYVREMELSLSKYNNGFPRTKFKIWQSIEEGIVFYSFVPSLFEFRLWQQFQSKTGGDHFRLLFQLLLGRDNPFEI